MSTDRRHRLGSMDLASYLNAIRLARSARGGFIILSALAIGMAPAEARIGPRTRSLLYGLGGGALLGGIAGSLFGGGGRTVYGAPGYGPPGYGPPAYYAPPANYYYPYPYGYPPSPYYYPPAAYGYPPQPYSAPNPPPNYQVPPGYRLVPIEPPATSEAEPTAPAPAQPPPPGVPEAGPYLPTPIPDGPPVAGSQDDENDTPPVKPAPRPQVQQTPL